MNNKTCATKLMLAADSCGIAAVLDLLGSGIAVKLPISGAFCDTHIDELNLSTRARNGLMRIGADTVGKLADLIMAENGLGSVRNLGRKSIAEIKTDILTEGYARLDKRARLAFWQQFVSDNDF